ncbi:MULTISPECIES: hypothetical protein [unclassified Bradyrhizobium]|uniref:hypothetical protein n=1 Tax=unclassified Bradyrhizobium TaxID=2631580 RepID=UPI0028E1AFCB|nr:MULTISPECIES: hypothetical protein [unclassified Bradyrhizobium]
MTASLARNSAIGSEREKSRIGTGCASFAIAAFMFFDFFAITRVCTAQQTVGLPQ